MNTLALAMLGVAMKHHGDIGDDEMDEGGEECQVVPARAVVQAIMAEYQRGNDQRAFRYSFSGAGDPCLRALVYDAQDHDDNAPPAVGRREVSWSLSAVCGTAVGDALEKAGMRLGFTSQKRAHFDTGAIRVDGSTDTVTPDLVLDWKLAGEKKWERVRSKPDPKHQLQVNAYAVALDKPRWALCYVRAVTIFDGSTTPEVKVHEGAADVALAQDLCGIWEQVDHHRKLRTLPERVFEAAPDKYPCSWCSHQARCLTGPEEGNP